MVCCSCDGSYPEDCDDSRDYSDITSVSLCPFTRSE